MFFVQLINKSKLNLKIREGVPFEKLFPKGNHLFYKNNSIVPFFPCKDEINPLYKLHEQIPIKELNRNLNLMSKLCKSYVNFPIKPIIISLIM